MAERFISSSERTTALAKGVDILARMGNLTQQDSELDRIEVLEWHPWVHTWGQKMSNQAQKIQFDMMTWAINYRD